MAKNSTRWAFMGGVWKGLRSAVDLQWLMMMMMMIDDDCDDDDDDDDDV